MNKKPTHTPEEIEDDLKHFSDPSKLSKDAPEGWRGCYEAACRLATAYRESAAERANLKERIDMAEFLVRGGDRDGALDVLRGGPLTVEKKEKRCLDPELHEVRKCDCVLEPCGECDLCVNGYQGCYKPVTWFGDNCMACDREKAECAAKEAMELMVRLSEVEAERGKLKNRVKALEMARLEPRRSLQEKIKILENNIGAVKSSLDAKIDVFEAENKILKEEYSSRLARASDLIKKKDEALEPFARNADWTEQEPGRACGMGCDFGETGPGPLGNHDFDCPMDKARQALSLRLEDEP